MPSPRTLKMHLPVQLLPLSFWEQRCKMKSGQRAYENMGQILLCHPRAGLQEHQGRWGPRLSSPCITPQDESGLVGAHPHLLRAGTAWHPQPLRCYGWRHYMSCLMTPRGQGTEMGVNPGPPDPMTLMVPPPMSPTPSLPQPQSSA